MKLLIRFEDTYGLYDIYCALNAMQCENINNISKILKINDDLYIQFGLNISKCYALSDTDIKHIKAYGITDILFVSDVDNMSGDKTQPMTEDSISGLIKGINEQLRTKQLSYINIKFMLSIYSAETVMLYQYVSNKWLNLDTTKYIHAVNTNALHLVILTACVGLKNPRDAKRMRNFIDKDTLKTKLETHNMKCIDFNDKCIRWLLGEDTYFTEDEAKQLVREAHTYHKNNVDKPKKLIVNNIVIDMGDKIFDICKQLGVLYR